MLTLRRTAGTPAIGLPASRISPSVGCSKPAIMRRVVVLPQPDGPRKRVERAAGDAQVHPVDGDDVAEPLGHAEDLDVRERASPGSDVAADDWRRRRLEGVRVGEAVNGGPRAVVPVVERLSRGDRVAASYGRPLAASTRIARSNPHLAGAGPPDRPRSAPARVPMSRPGTRPGRVA